MLPGQNIVNKLNTKLFFSLVIGEISSTIKIYDQETEWLKTENE